VGVSLICARSFDFSRVSLLITSVFLRAFPPHFPHPRLIRNFALARLTSLLLRCFSLFLCRVPSGFSFRLDHSIPLLLICFSLSPCFSPSLQSRIFPFLVAGYESPAASLLLGHSAPFPYRHSGVLFHDQPFRRWCRHRRRPPALLLWPLPPYRPAHSLSYFTSRDSPPILTPPSQTLTDGDNFLPSYAFPTLSNLCCFSFFSPTRNASALSQTDSKV